jgi:hypothetical protein
MSPDTAAAPVPKSKAATALAAILATPGKTQDALRARYHRTQLWRWASGRGRPDHDNASELQKLSRGRVRADGWAVVAEVAS